MAGKHSNCSAAVEPVASGRVDDDGDDDDEDDTDAEKKTESPSALGDESRASQELGWSDTWQKCLGGVRRPRPRLRRGANPLAIGTGEPPGGGEGDVGDANDDREQRPSDWRRSDLDSAYNRRHGNRPTTETAASRELCCTNCLRRQLTRHRSLHLHCYYC